MTCPNCERHKLSASMWRNKAYEANGTPLPWNPEELLRKEYERGRAAGAAEEREACAKVCENMTLEWKDQPNIAQAELATLMDCALAIRARGQQ